MLDIDSIMVINISKYDRHILKIISKILNRVVRKISLVSRYVKKVKRQFIRMDVAVPGKRASKCKDSRLGIIF